MTMKRRCALGIGGAWRVSLSVLYTSPTKGITVIIAYMHTSAPSYVPSHFKLGTTYRPTRAKL
jgi:hypothetical protein